MKFQEITGATKADKTFEGDASLGGHLVEIKQASTKQLNQIRAVKFITLVVYDVPEDCWFVVPAQEVVELIRRKAETARTRGRVLRGQHTENPFECVKLSVTDLAKFRVARQQDLRSRVLRAATGARKYPAVKVEMDRIKSESTALAGRSLRRVNRAFAKQPAKSRQAD